MVSMLGMRFPRQVFSTFTGTLMSSVEGPVLLNCSNLGAVNTVRFEVGTQSSLDLTPGKIALSRAFRPAEVFVKGKF